MPAAIAARFTRVCAYEIAPNRVRRASRVPIFMQYTTLALLALFPYVIVVVAAECRTLTL